MSDVEEMSEADLKAEVEHNQWSQDMAVEEAVNAVKPDASPVCVEVKELEWENTVSFMEETWSAVTRPFLYTITTTGAEFRSSWRYSMQSLPFGLLPHSDTLEAAQAACQADFERRTLELINARSVADVRAELLAEMMADATNRAADTNGRPGAGSLNEMYCHAMDYIKAFRRALTEGEG